jgi:hypothetical protein
MAEWGHLASIPQKCYDGFPHVARDRVASTTWSPHIEGNTPPTSPRMRDVGVNRHVGPAGLNRLNYCTDVRPPRPTSGAQAAPHATDPPRGGHETAGELPRAPGQV